MSIEIGIMEPLATVASVQLSLMTTSGCRVHQRCVFRDAQHSKRIRLAGSSIRDCCSYDGARG